MTELALKDGPIVPGAGGGFLVRSGADLVELVEQLYQRLFRVALGLTIGADVLTVVLAGLGSSSWPRGQTAPLAGGCAVAALLVFRRSPDEYLWLRARWRASAVPAALGGVVLVLGGPGGPLWFVALASIAVTCVVASRRLTIALDFAVTACYVFGTALPGGSLLAHHDPTRLAAASALALNGVPCVAVVEWLARFVLRLHQLELECVGWGSTAGRPG